MSQQKQSLEPLLSVDAEWNRLTIAGNWIPAENRDTITVIDPSKQTEWKKVPAGTVRDVDQAFKAAKKAQEGWQSLSPRDRSRCIRELLNQVEANREVIMDLLKTESGSSNMKASMELDHTEAIIEEAASFPYRIKGERADSVIPGKENIVKREPAGVVSVISPWNFPLFLSMRAVVTAIAAGNAVVLKPASETPVTGGLLIARLFEEAGVPTGLINVVTGYGSEIGDRVAGHPDVDVVAFTGSSEVGRRVAKKAVDSFAFPALELGGNGCHVVLDDVDVENAAAAGAYGTFAHQGQVCISINRHLVHEDIYDEYIEKLVQKAEMLPSGSAHDMSTVIGPIINKSQRDKIIEFIEDTIEEGATLETGGDYDGLVVEPTVLSNATNGMTASCNEHFGPIAPVIPIADDSEAIELANATEYGLSSSVFSADRNRAEDIADEIDSGMVHINDQPINNEPHIPFGGMKASGMGRYNGKYILEEMTETKWVSVQREPRSYPM